MKRKPTKPKVALPMEPEVRIGYDVQVGQPFLCRYDKVWRWSWDSTTDQLSRYASYGTAKTIRDQYAKRRGVRARVVKITILREELP